MGDRPPSLSRFDQPKIAQTLAQFFPMTYPLMIQFDRRWQGYKRSRLLYRLCDSQLTEGHQCTGSKVLQAGVTTVELPASSTNSLYCPAVRAQRLASTQISPMSISPPRRGAVSRQRIGASLSH